MEFTHNKNDISVYEGDRVLACVTFPKVKGDVVNVDHTFVDDDLRGQGVAGELMNELVKELKASNRKAKLTCSYAVSWFAKHPEYSELIAE